MSRNFKVSNWALECALSAMILLATAGVSRMEAQTNVNALIQGRRDGPGKKHRDESHKIGRHR